MKPAVIDDTTWTIKDRIIQSEIPVSIAGPSMVMPPVLQTFNAPAGTVPDAHVARGF